MEDTLREVLSEESRFFQAWSAQMLRCAQEGFTCSHDSENLYELAPFFLNHKERMSDELRGNLTQKMLQYAKSTQWGTAELSSTMRVANWSSHLGGITPEAEETVRDIIGRLRGGHWELVTRENLASRFDGLSQDRKADPWNRLSPDLKRIWDEYKATITPPAAALPANNEEDQILRS